MRYLLLVCLLSLCGCATIMHGSTQEVGITSAPSGGLVTVDNIAHGQTPLLASLARKNPHIIKVELADYPPYETAVTPHVSGWIWGNLFFGGIIGAVIDVLTGGAYTLDPETITVTMNATPFPPPSAPPAPVAVESIPRPGIAYANVPPSLPEGAPAVRLHPRYATARLFLQPKPDAELLSVIGRNGPLRVIAQKGAWIYIETPDGRRGWIAREWTQE